MATKASAPAKKLYTRFAEIGRVVLIQYGPDEGKLATIIDILDQNRVRRRARRSRRARAPARGVQRWRSGSALAGGALTRKTLPSPITSLPPPALAQALVDGPENRTGVRRQIINFKWVALTDMKVKVSRNARQKTLTKEWAAAEVSSTWAKSAWAKKLAAKKAKAATTDFDRFQDKLKKQAVSAFARTKLVKATAP